MKDSLSHHRSKRFVLLISLSFMAASIALILTFAPMPGLSARAKALANFGTTPSRGSRQSDFSPAVREAIERARYKMTLEGRAAIDPLITTTETHLFASDGASGDNFGLSVAISGDTAVVGACCDNNLGGANAGSAYVFVRNGTSWSEQAHLFASDGSGNDQFGSSVAISGDTIVVGALFDTTAAGGAAGSAYVFVRNGTTWSEQAHLFASDAAGQDFFGNSVAISGDTIIVGAVIDDTGAGGTNAGSTYVFVRSGTSWSEQAHLFASDGAAGDTFGVSVAISGDTIVVGASNDTTAGGANAGSAYVFVRSGTSWSEQAHLFASDGAADDGFGNYDQVAISGDTIVIGADSDNTAAGTEAGSAYVFVRSGTSWSEQAHLFASDAAALDLFGGSVAISGDTVAVGAEFDDIAGGTNAGSAYVFVRSGTSWSPQGHLFASDGEGGDNFGQEIAIEGETILVGAYADSTEDDSDIGSVYVYAPNPDTDGDGIFDDVDNCPAVPNPGQANADLDETGDACDPDDDNDGILDGGDNCPLAANSDQADTDGDGIGNACDPDDDNDGVLDGNDNCSLIANSDQANADGDGAGNVCDPDDDNDGVVDGVDNCSLVANSDQSDNDNDGTGNACDLDDDNDGVPDGADNCPLVANSDQADNDNDGIGNVCDPDDDNDSVPDGADNCPLVSNADQTDTDGDGIGNVCDAEPPTPAGSNVSVVSTVGPTTITNTFASVINGGITTVTPTNPSSVGTLPGGFNLTGSSLAFEISTTATFTAPVTVCFQVPTLTDSEFANLRVLHSVGKLDLTVANSGSSNASIRLGNGAGGFGSVTSFSAATSPSSVAVGDLNDDKRLDLIIANQSTNNVTVRLGNGTGSFPTATNFPVGTSPRSVAIGDFNNDRKLDLAVANATTNNVSVLLGTGTGSFAPATNFSAGSSPRFVAVGDFNADSNADLATANNGSNNLSVLLGNGTGGFSAATNFPVGTNPRAVAVGDFNADGKLDLAAANYNSNNVSVLLGNGAGGFGTATNFSVGTNPSSIAVGNLNADGNPDLVVGNEGSNNVSVRLGNGTGGFGAATNFAVGTTPRSVVLGDFSNDNKLDLAVANAGSNNMSLRLGNGTGSFGATTNFAMGTSPVSISAGNFNGDTVVIDQTILSGPNAPNPASKTICASVTSFSPFVLAEKIASADVDIEKSDATDPVPLGSNITYNIEVENNGPDNATGITVTDRLPAGVDFVSASSGCAHDSGTVTCSLASLANQAETKWTVIVHPNVTGRFRNTATVTANESDPNLSNNSDDSDTTVVIGVASVSLNPTSVRGGNSLTGTVNLSSAAPNGGVVVTLSSSNTSVAKPTVNSITIPRDQTSGTFTVKSFPVSSIKTVKIKAAANGISKEATLTVKP